MNRGPSQWALAFDQLINAILSGDARHTISARTGYGVSRGKRWAKIAAPVIDAFFGKGHCEAQAKREGLIHG